MEGVLSAALQRVAEQGLLGLILVIVGFALYQRDKALLTALTERADDVKALTAALTECASVMRAVAAAQDKAADGSRDLANAISAMQAIVEQVGRRL